MYVIRLSSSYTTKPRTRQGFLVNGGQSWDCPRRRFACSFLRAHSLRLTGVLSPAFRLSSPHFPVGSHPSILIIYNKTPHRAGFSCKWRIEWDLNPRYPLGVHTISNRAPSTTRPSIQIKIFLIIS